MYEKTKKHIETCVWIETKYPSSQPRHTKTSQTIQYSGNFPNKYCCPSIDKVSGEKAPSPFAMLLHPRIESLEAENDDIRCPKQSIFQKKAPLSCYKSSMAFLNLSPYSSAILAKCQNRSKYYQANHSKWILAFQNMIFLYLFLRTVAVRTLFCFLLWEHSESLL